MKNQILILLVFIFSSCSSASQARKSLFEQKANLLCDEVSEDPKVDYEKHFHKSFRDAVPYKTIVSVFKSIHKDFGPCREVKLQSEDGLNGTFFTVHNDKIDVRFIMNIMDGQIVGLLYKGKVAEAIVFKKKSDIYETLAKKPYEMSLLFRKLGGGAYLEHNQKGAHALGSVFKLYILAGLVEKINKGELSWDQKFPIQEKLKSLPSGKMQDLKPGTMISLKRFAGQMIKISDNTATDHLLNIVGQEYVENLMRVNRLNNYLEKNAPFISTLDMFKTRGFFNKKEALKYKRASRALRQKMLDKIAYTDRADLLKRLDDWRTPRYIKEIEWYASANNICDLLEWTDDLGDKGFRSAIGQNTPFIDLSKSKRWSYAGYKGGSEPGVLEMAYLLEDKAGERWCLYVGQNSEEDAFDQSEYFSFVQGVLNFLDNEK